MEILNEEVGFKFTISVFEAFVTSSPNYIAIRGWRSAPARHYLKVSGVVTIAIIF
jgi:hypothetical protein